MRPLLRRLHSRPMQRGRRRAVVASVLTQSGSGSMSYVSIKRSFQSVRMGKERVAFERLTTAYGSGRLTVPFSHTTWHWMS